jgi:hypothetical protein
MRKLRILIAEVIGLGLLIAWLMWKYPEFVDSVIPWVALLVIWHFTWEFILDTEPFRRGSAVLGKRINKMLIWPLVFVLGGGISLLYWVGINKSLIRLASLAKKRTESISSTSQTTQNTTKAEVKPEEKPQIEKPKVKAKPAQETQDLGVRRADETTVLPPNSSAIISNHPLSKEEHKDLERLDAEANEARNHLTSDTDRLTVRDLFWVDFESPEDNLVRHTGFTIKNGDTGKLTHISSAVIYQNIAGVKILAFYIPYTDETPRMVVSLASMYKQPLSDPLESSVMTGKIATGDSEQVSSANLVLSNRVFVYHEFYLSPEQIIAARDAWKNQGLTVILRGTDYLENRKLEAKIKKLGKH